MSGKHPFHPDSVIGAYVEDLLSVPDDCDPYLEPEPRPTARKSSVDKPLARDPASAPATKLAERPALRLNQISPAFRQAARESLAPESEQESAHGSSEPVAGPRALADPMATPAPEAETSPVSRGRPVSTEVPQGDPVLAATTDTQPWEQGRPAWASKSFECLIFRVAGLQLAVPLVLLGAIHRLDSDLTPLFGRPDWFMGLYREGDQTIKVADTARWVMPERYRRDDAAHYEFVIRLDNSQWGLACHEVAQSFTVQPEDVKWRTANSRRQWLAGTIREHMCALLDVSRLAGMLAEAEQGRELDMSR